MTEFKHKEKEGSLFENAYKTKENQPDFKGKLMFGGIEYDLAGWKNKTKNGDPYTKVKISEPLPSKSAEEKSYKSVGDSLRERPVSKHMNDYVKAKQGVDDRGIAKDEDIPF
tara:strand:+ start:265 stop:600 length:336 start_codon:yes stop_codon:yes gene_type:complete